MTRMEDMANELFLEIFDYLDGCDIMTTFHNLNIRFRCLIKDSLLLLKINLCSEVAGNRKQVITPYKYQIQSLYLSDHLTINRFFTLYPIDSSFDRLESLSLRFIRSDQLVLFHNLNLLPRLFRLIIHLLDDDTYLFDIYAFIFRLPVLKHAKISSLISKFPFTSIPNHVSSIEYLVIDHSFKISELFYILSFTPKLLRLIIKKSLSTFFLPHDRDSLLTLPNLTHLHIDQCAMNFNVFGIFITEISSQLQVLKISTFDDSSYLDADRWERLISQKMPQLRKFYFQYHELFNHNYHLSAYHQSLNRFTSPFWIDRQWVFDVIIDLRQITYSIQPYRKRWFEFNECDNKDDSDFTSDTEMQHTDIINSSIPLCKNVQLTITSHFSQTYGRLLIDKINSILTSVKITSLDIDCSKILITTLVKLIDLLPNLDSLRILYLSLPESRCFIREKAEDMPTIIKKEKIIKVNLEHISQFIQIRFLIKLCPCMQYLVISCTNDPHLISFIQSILKSLKCLILLCLNFSSVDDKTIQELQTTMNFEHLYQYTIERMNNQICLRRKLQ